MAEVASVRVAARVRPFTSTELAGAAVEAVFASPETNSVTLGSGAAEKSFVFDHVFAAPTTNAEFYEHCVAPLISRAVDGYNVTVFAYGQTGSGKTHTVMEGYEELASGATNFDYGITPRLMRDIFAALNADVGADGRLLAFNVKVASLEIYNEQMYDLLSDAGSKAAQNVIIRENDAGDQVLTGIVEVPVSSAADMAKWLAKGMQARAVASTNMNARSSRSHAVFTITIEQTLSSSSAFEAGAEAAPAANNDAQLVRRVSRIHIVDLAGSERAKKTGADGARLREASSINRGLLALGNVINALAAAEDSAAAASAEASSSSSGHAVTSTGGAASGAPHIPFRDSKLTRLLKSSLGGNAHTLMIACCSPADSNLEETLSTLRYAARARAIKNKASVNVDPMTSQMAALRKQVKELQAALMAARASGGMLPSGADLPYAGALTVAQLPGAHMITCTCAATLRVPCLGAAQHGGSAPHAGATCAECARNLTERAAQPSAQSEDANSPGSEALESAMHRLMALESGNAMLSREASRLSDALSAAGEEYDQLASALSDAEERRDVLSWQLAQLAGACRSVLRKCRDSGSSSCSSSAVAGDALADIRVALDLLDQKKPDAASLPVVLSATVGLPDSQTALASAPHDASAFDDIQLDDLAMGVPLRCAAAIVGGGAASHATAVQATPGLHDPEYREVSAPCLPEAAALLPATRITPRTDSALPSTAPSQAHMRAQFGALTRQLTQKTALLEASIRTGSVVQQSFEKLASQLREQEERMQELQSQRDALDAKLKASGKSGGPRPAATAAAVVAAGGGHTPSFGGAPDGTVSHAAAESDPEALALREQLRSREEEITQLKDRIKATSRALALSRREEARANQLADEIRSLRAARAAMQRAMRDASERARVDKQVAERAAAAARAAADKKALELERSKRECDELSSRIKRKDEELHRVRKQAQEMERARRAGFQAGGAVALASELTRGMHDAALGFASTTSWTSADAATAGALVASSAAAAADVNFSTAVGLHTAGTLAGTRDATFVGAVGKHLNKQLADSSALVSLAEALTSGKFYSDLPAELRRKLEGLMGGTVALRRATAYAEHLHTVRAAVAERLATLDAACPPAERAALERQRDTYSVQLAACNDVVIALNTQLDALSGVGASAPAGKRGVKKRGAALFSPELLAGGNDMKAVMWLSSVVIQLACACDATLKQCAADVAAAREAANLARVELLTAHAAAAAQDASATQALQDAEERMLLLVQQRTEEEAGGGAQFSDAFVRIVRQETEYLMQQHATWSAGMDAQREHALLTHSLHETTAELLRMEQRCVQLEEQAAAQAATLASMKLTHRSTRAGLAHTGHTDEERNEDGGSAPSQRELDRFSALAAMGELAAAEEREGRASLTKALQLDSRVPTVPQASQYQLTARRSNGDEDEAMSEAGSDTEPDASLHSSASSDDDSEYDEEEESPRGGKRTQKRTGGGIAAQRTSGAGLPAVKSRKAVATTGTAGAAPPESVGDGSDDVPAAGAPAKRRRIVASAAHGDDAVRVPENAVASSAGAGATGGDASGDSGSDHCACAGKCATKRCACRAVGRLCTAACECRGCSNCKHDEPERGEKEGEPMALVGDTSRALQQQVAQATAPGGAVRAPAASRPSQPPPDLIPVRSSTTVAQTAPNAGAGEGAGAEMSLKPAFSVARVGVKNTSAHASKLSVGRTSSSDASSSSSSVKSQSALSTSTAGGALVPSANDTAASPTSGVLRTGVKRARVDATATSSTGGSVSAVPSRMPPRPSMVVASSSTPSAVASVPAGVTSLIKRVPTSGASTASIVFNKPAATGVAGTSGSSIVRSTTPSSTRISQLPTPRAVGVGGVSSSSAAITAAARSLKENAGTGGVAPFAAKTAMLTSAGAVRPAASGTHVPRALGTLATNGSSFVTVRPKPSALVTERTNTSRF